MPALVALSVVIAVLAGVWTSLSIMWGLVTFAAFVSWACFFASGGGAKGLKTTLITNFTGVVWGVLIIRFSDGIAAAAGTATPVALGISLGIIAGVMVLASKVGIWAYVPGVFMGTATYFGAGLDFTGSAIGLVVGAFLGIASAKLSDALTAKSKIAAAEAPVVDAAEPL
ncbi:membrane protein [Paenibacillus darwinianus]|uniref:Membrane protein n=1 Tax=Paenibacillus darwinianus TaxID=1380763 RepID=A0A9W5RZ82_9BACL|nr:DUF1097 domain-containing protein [Paenibacillus darwinianus]EXX84686.1 membrane protein [Paenibacillus darwinianus]EXX84703.1 membrane protein [Paenibacillus darwinianus]EXX84725.1 membrane protein [Paenibacillus darwinianus]